MRSLIVASHLKGAACAGRRLLEDQADLLPVQMLLFGARILGALQIAGKIEQVAKLARAYSPAPSAASDCED